MFHLSDIPHKDNSSFLDHYSLDSDIEIGSYYRITKVVLISTGEKRIAYYFPKIHLSGLYINRFIAQLSAQLQLDHLNFCRLYEYFQDTDTYYIITERAAGGTLSEKLMSSPHILPEKICVDYMQQIFSILVHLKRINIVHRGITPEKLLLRAENENTLKLVGFEGCKVLGQGEMATELAGSAKYIGSEMLRGEHVFSRDMWSAGIIMYLLLSGTLPFSGRNRKAISRDVPVGEITYQEPAWERINNNGKDLLQRILVDRSLRISPSEALAHPWFETYQNIPPSINKAAQYFANLSEFKAKGKCKKYIYRHIAAACSFDNEGEELTRMFRYLDVNYDGLLSKEEIKRGSLKLFGKRVKNVDAEIDKIFVEADLDGSGELSYNEFIVAAIGRNKVLDRHKLEEVFKTIDIDGNEFIDKQELTIMLSRFIKDFHGIEEFFRIADTNKDGLIDLPEFIRAMRKT